MPEILPVATAEQIEHVRALLRQYQSELPADICFPSREWLHLPGEYAPPRGALLLATVSGQPVGCVGLRPFATHAVQETQDAPPVCEMKRLYLRPTFRGDNLGRKLANEVLAVARRMGYARVRLDTHTQTMQSAVALYRSLGFIDVASDPLPPMSGLSYMELRLDPPK